MREIVSESEIEESHERMKEKKENKERIKKKKRWGKTIQQIEGTIFILFVWSK